MLVCHYGYLTVQQLDVKLNVTLLIKKLAWDSDHVYTPVLANVDLYKTSGHWDHYQEDMFPPMQLDETESMVLRPMNCPTSYDDLCK